MVGYASLLSAYFVRARCRPRALELTTAQRTAAAAAAAGPRAAADAAEAAVGSVLVSSSSARRRRRRLRVRGLTDSAALRGGCGGTGADRSVTRPAGQAAVAGPEHSAPPPEQAGWKQQSLGPYRGHEFGGTISGMFLSEDTEQQHCHSGN